MLLIAGEAGIGKSRLLRQFAGALAGGRAACGFARCVEFIQRPLGPLRDALLDLERTAPVIFRSDSTSRRLIERLTFERAGDPSRARSAELLFEAIDATFARLAERRTLVVLIEDLHWADRSTLGFLAFLTERVAARRVLVVATYRAEEVDAGHPQLAEFSTLLSLGAVSNIALRALDQSVTQRLVEITLPRPHALSTSMIAGIVRLSQGNPFFAEELTKSALEGGDPFGRMLPLSIRGAVLARAALLNETQRDVLSMAAVLGERFSVDRLCALLPLSRGAVLTALERARALHLIVDEPRSRGELQFRHALTQEVLYGELLAERVRPLHETIGRELEARPDRDAVIVDLAHHWWRAGDARRAAKYAQAAGDRAFAMGAIADAVVFYERTLAERPLEDADGAGIEHKIGVCFGLLGRPAVGVPRLRRAGDLYLRAGDYEGFAKNASSLGAQLHNAGDTVAALNLWRETIDLIAERAPVRTVDLLRARMAYNCVASLDFTSALTLVHEICEPQSDPLVAGLMHQTLFKIAAMNGDLERWTSEVDAALAASQTVDDAGFMLRLTHCQAALDAVGLGESERAQAHFGHTQSERSAGYAASFALALAASAFEHTLRGDFAGARKMIERVDALAEDEYATQVHAKSAQLALGVCAGDDAMLDWEGAEDFLYYGIRRGMKVSVGLVGGPFAWALGLRGDDEGARAWVHRIADAVPCVHRFPFAFLAAAQFGAADDVAVLRRLLATACARSSIRVNHALLGLFDAFCAQRGFGERTQQESAQIAAEGFGAIGWPWLAARALELAGELPHALSIYRRLGALRDVRRLEVHDAPAAGEGVVLSPREREVAGLVARAKSNDEIARALGISPRTVEKHVSAALDKLSCSTRAQLAILFAERR